MLAHVQQELEALLAERAAWVREADGLKDTIRIKDKILHDQQDSIDKLKHQLSDLQVTELNTLLTTNLTRAPVV